MYTNREGHGSPLQCSCLENPRDRGAWWAAVYGAAWSWTRLKQLVFTCGQKPSVPPGITALSAVIFSIIREQFLELSEQNIFLISQLRECMK